MKVVTPQEQWLFSVVRIESDHGMVGTAFISNLEEGDDVVPMFVTNKHVVVGASKVTFWLHRKEGGVPKLGAVQPIAVTLGGDWREFVGHPDTSVDVAAMPIGPILAGKQDIYFYRGIQPALIPSQAQLEKLNAVEEVLFIGFPAGIYDPVNYLPIVRRGITATPASVNYAGLPAFLIDASVFEGSSGSPVFIANMGTYYEEGSIIVGSRFLFLGILAAAHSLPREGRIEFREATAAQTPIASSEEMIDLGLVFRSSVVLETMQNAHSVIQSRIPS